jgi:UDP-GlcNAc:undecaprenyl-phosphate/decaprenyl-phosphate GlcNAc-1-phosphate transferase
VSAPPPLLEVASVAFGAALALTPITRRIAVATGFLDHPDVRKMHPGPTPLLGGVAVAVSAVAGGLVSWLLLSSNVAVPHPGIVVGALLSLGLGLWDDRHPMSALGKLIAQFVAAGCLVYWGARVPYFGAHPVAGTVALLGVVALLNAINFLDAMDGIVAALVPVTAGGFVALALLHGARVDLALAWGLVGGCCGFLVYNAPPARIFLGDAGSHLLGFALAALGLQALQGSFSWAHAASVVLLFAYPLFDVAFVIVDRLLAGRPIHVAGVDHVTHRLGRLCGQWGTLAVTTLAVAASVCVGVWVWSRSDMVSVNGALIVCGLGYAVFGILLRRACPTPRFDT